MYNRIPSSNTCFLDTTKFHVIIAASSAAGHDTTSCLPILVVIKTETVPHTPPLLQSIVQLSYPSNEDRIHISP